MRPDSAADPHRWLEEVSSERAMTWVRNENVRTENILQNDPRYDAIYASALAMAQAKDRIPYVTFIGGALYNFWQDSAHVRGIWRKTSLTSYRLASPLWVTVLDLDALAAKEKANWVWHGADCVQPEQVRCLISLSDGGEDATTIREFDLLKLRFVQNGFSLPKGKQNVTWMTKDTLLVAREWSPGELTASGYPFVVRKLPRGRPLSAATEIYRGNKSDVLVSPRTLEDAEGRHVSIITRAISFFQSEHFLVRPRDVVRLEIPRKSNIVELLDGQVIVRLSEAWATGTSTIGSGALASFDAAAAMRTPECPRPGADLRAGAAGVGGWGVGHGDAVAGRHHAQRDGPGAIVRAGRRRDVELRSAGVAGQRVDVGHHHRQPVRSCLRGRDGIPDAEQCLAGRCGDEGRVAGEGTGATLRCVTRRGGAVRGDIHRWYRGAVFHRASEGDADGRLEPDHPLRVRRIRGVADAAVRRRGGEALAGAWRCVRRGEHPWWWGVRAGMA
ncbi:MAG: hypothetical protein U5K74_14490 [Gemmatimonadaceae bacterium]|nr:hypothetical protein [Gemmatimonadaceae bacterium]